MELLGKVYMHENILLLLHDSFIEKLIKLQKLWWNKINLLCVNNALSNEISLRTNFLNDV